MQDKGTRIVANDQFIFRFSKEPKTAAWIFEVTVADEKPYEIA